MDPAEKALRYYADERNWNGRELRGITGIPATQKALDALQALAAARARSGADDDIFQVDGLLFIRSDARKLCAYCRKPWRLTEFRNDAAPDACVMCSMTNPQVPLRKAGGNDG